MLAFLIAGSCGACIRLRNYVLARSLYGKVDDFEQHIETTMPILLFTYIATEILAPFFASFLILTAILFLGRLVPLLDTIFDFGIGLADFIRLCSYILPKLMLFSIPMACTMGVIIAVTRMINDNEIMALKAGGIGLYRLIPAVAIVSIAISGLTYYSAITLIPKGTVAMQQLFFQLAKEKIDKGIQEKQFSEGIKKVVLYVDQVDQESKEWQGVYVSDMRHENMPVTIVAKNGNLTAKLDQMLITLHLKNGTMDRASEDITQTIHFQDYSLNLPLTAPGQVAGHSKNDVGKNGLTQPQLLEQVAQHGAKSDRGLSMLIEYHKRIALSVGCFILGLLGLPLALLARPGRRPIGVPLGLFFFIFYYILFTAGKAFAEGGNIPVSVCIWTPNALFAIFTLFLTRLVAKEKTVALLDRLANTTHSILQKLPLPKKIRRAA